MSVKQGQDGDPSAQQPNMVAAALEAARKTAFVILTVGSLAVGLASDSAEAHPSIPVQYDANGCVLPYSSDTVQIAQLVAEPESSLMVADEIGTGKGGDPHSAAEAYRLEIARRYGLHIYDAKPTIDQLKAEDANGTLPYQTYLSAAQNFMIQFGIDVRLATPDDNLAYHGKPLTAVQLADPAMKTTLLSLLSAYSNVPAEYVALGHEKHIILAGNLAPNGAAAYAVIDEEHDTTVYDATLGIDTHTYGHELGHDVDATLCRITGMSKDTEFAAINGSGPDLYNGKTWNPAMPNFADFQQADIDAYTKAVKLAAAGHADAACALLDAQNAEAAKLTSWSEYHPNTAEAKAELYGELFDPQTYVTMLDPRYTIMRKQFLFLLARLHAVEPGLAACNVGTTTTQGGAPGPVPTDPTKGFGK
jgi:hypothetical protein